jgi:hypothetical protein
MQQLPELHHVHLTLLLLLLQLVLQLVPLQLTVSTASVHVQGLHGCVRTRNAVQATSRVATKIAPTNTLKAKAAVKPSRALSFLRSAVPVMLNCV